VINIWSIYDARSEKHQPIAEHLMQ